MILQKNTANTHLVTMAVRCFKRWRTVVYLMLYRLYP